jgi:hypothetical protein
VAAFAGPLTAAPVIALKTDGGGIPSVLVGNGGWGLLQHRYLHVTSEGFVVASDPDQSGTEHHILSPSLARANNGTGHSQLALMQHWNPGQNLYAGSVGSGATVGNKEMNEQGFTRQTAQHTSFGWTGGGTSYINEFQYQDSSSQYDGDSGKAALLSKSTSTIQSGLHKSDLEYIGVSPSDSTVSQMVGGLSGSTNGPLTGIVKMEWGAVTGQDSTTVGTRTTTGGGKLIGGSASNETTLLADLVPGIADTVNGFGLNPTNGNLYLVSTTTGATNDLKHVYVSAISFAFGTLATNSTAIYVDLNPDDPTRNYLELTYDSGDSFSDLLFGRDVAFSNDGTQMYISNDADRVFIANVATVPEPVSASMLGLSGLALLRRRRTASAGDSLPAKR